MKKILIALVVALPIVFLFQGCEDRTEISAPVLSTGSANLSRYFAVGNSLTAGYQSGALYKSGQEYSYARLMSMQMGTSFETPWVSDPGLAPGRIEVQSFNPATGSLVTKINTANGAPTNLGYTGIYNNLGIPGATLVDFFSTTSSANSVSPGNAYFDVILRSTTASPNTMWSSLKAAKPTFVSFWLGNNDILGYATSGGTVGHTPTAVFGAIYKQAMDSLKTLNAGVVVMNIPDVSKLPYFTTVGPALIRAGTPQIVGVDKDGVVRAMDLTKVYLTLPSQAQLAAGFGAPTKPLPSAYILDEAEIVEVQTTTAAFNTIIATESAAKGFALADLNAFFNEIATTVSTKGAYVVEGIPFTLSYFTGQIFSLDGVHITSRANGIVANKIIDAINAKYGSNLSKVTVASLPGSYVFSSSPVQSVTFSQGFPTLAF